LKAKSITRLAEIFRAQGSVVVMGAHGCPCHRTAERLRNYHLRLRHAGVVGASLAPVLMTQLMTQLAQRQRRRCLALAGKQDQGKSKGEGF
jgi:hypothetical protein